MDGVIATAIATVIAAAIGGLVAWATSRSAAKAQVRTAETTSRTDIEKEAFARAERYYAGALQRQDREITRQDEELNEVHAELTTCKHRIRDLEAENEQLKHDLALTRDDVRRLSAVIAARGEDPGAG